MASPPSIDPRVAKTHAALFDTWLPLDELPIPPGHQAGYRRHRD
jgi:hypothetical protein